MVPAPGVADSARRRALRTVRRRVLAWYVREHRDFPWRRTRDPYAVLVSEVMLQQTQARRVVERFERFMARFPSVAALAAASEADVLAEWSGLGYNRRALALRRAASEVVTGGWGHAAAELERLAGVGPYTARALASLAFGEAVGVVDTNVRRWLIRRFGLPATVAAQDLQQLADDLATADPSPSPMEVAAWTHASMELGAGVCRARAPRCVACPVARSCPSRGRATLVAVPRQAPFRRSRRAGRGALVRVLAAADGYALTVPEAMRSVPDGVDGPRVLADLEREGLVHADGAYLRLGPPAAGGAAGTIDG